MHPTEQTFETRPALTRRSHGSRHAIVGLLVLGAVLGAVVGGVVAVRTATAGYTSTAEVLVGVGATGSGSGSSSSDANQYLTERLSTLRELVTSDAVVVPAARDLGTTPAALRPLVAVTSPGDTTVIDLAVGGVTPTTAARGGSAVLGAFLAAVTTSETPAGGLPRISTTVVGQPTTPPARSTLSPVVAVSVGAVVGLVLAGIGVGLWSSRRLRAVIGRFRRWVAAPGAR